MEEGSIICRLYDEGKVICYVRSSLWQNSIFIITMLLYLSIIVVVPSFSLSLFFSRLSLSHSLSLSLSLASQVEREARVDDGIAVSR